jgi:hypothetical protein
MRILWCMEGHCSNLIHLEEKIKSFISGYETVKYTSVRLSLKLFSTLSEACQAKSTDSPS